MKCLTNTHVQTMIMHTPYKTNETSSLLNFSLTSDSFSNLYKYLFTKGKCLKSTSRCTCKPDTWNNDYKNSFLKTINIEIGYLEERH